MVRRIMPDAMSKKEILSLSPNDTVLAAAKLMTRHRIGVLLVFDGEVLVGIISERDIAGRLVAEEKSPTQTRISEIMTPKPETISPKATVMGALQRMQEGRFRHLGGRGRENHRYRLDPGYLCRSPGRSGRSRSGAEAFISGSGCRPSLMRSTARN